MPEQLALTHESFNDALRELVAALGGAKKVGILMRPEKTIDDAARWVLDCLNPDRRERFDPDQLIWLLREGRRLGFHNTMHFLCAEAGYRAEPVEPEDERAALQRQVIDAASSLKVSLDRLERLTQAPVLHIAK